MQLWTIDGSFAIVDRKPELNPHDMRDVQRLGSMLACLLTQKHHIHEISMHLILVTNAQKEGVAEDPVHDVKEWVQHPCLLATGKLLLNKVGLKLVFAG